MTTMTAAHRLLLRAAFAALAALTALFVQTASAQMSMPFELRSPRAYTMEEKEKMQEIDKQYRDTLKKVPDKQKADPWAGARQDSPNGPTTKQR
jgi:hypothetical protein